MSSRKRLVAQAAEVTGMTTAAIAFLVVGVVYLGGRLRGSLAENVELRARIVVLKRELARRRH